jgi:hypothetical protein
MIVEVGIAFLICLVGVAAYAGIWEVRHTGQLITPLTLFLALCTADVFIPALFSVATGEFIIPVWASPISSDVVLNTCFLFLLSTFLFGFGYLLVRGSPRPALPAKSRPASLKWLTVLFCICAGFYLLSILFDIRLSGGLTPFLNKRMLRILVREAPVYSNGISGWTLRMSTSFLKSAFVLGGFFFYCRFRSRTSHWAGFICVAVCFGLAATTFFRGALLGLGLGFFVLENQRLLENGSCISAILKKNKYLVWAPFACLLLFVGYGVVRDYMQVKASRELLRWTMDPESTWSAVGQELERFRHGPSLMGLASVTEYFSVPEGRLDGRTLKDMLLLPVPRSIYKDKPDWYGIDDISKALRWPGSTQSAITMPGELYANFGPQGLCLMLAFGMFFGLLFRFSSHPYFHFAYPFVWLPMMLVSFWMSLTGIMNELIRLPLVLLVSAVAMGAGQRFWFFIVEYFKKQRTATYASPPIGLYLRPDR